MPRARPRRVLLASVSALLWLACPSAATARGELDPTFGQGGKVRSDFGEGQGAKEIVIDSAGRSVVLSTRGESGASRLIRYTPDGGLDPAFGDDGTVTIDTGPGGLPVTAMAVDESDRIVLGAAVTRTFPNADDLALLRYLPDGTLDPEFGANGVATVDHEPFEFLQSIQVDAAGRVLVLSWGFSPGSEIRQLVTRLNSDGTVDTTYGIGGHVALQVVGGDRVVTAIDSQQRLVIGLSGKRGRQSGLYITRLEATGDLDRDFGSTGYSYIGMGFPRSLALDPRDRPLMVLCESERQQRRFTVERLTGSGRADGSFGMDGIAAVSEEVGPSGCASAVAADSAGRVMLGGGVPTRRGRGTRDFGLVGLLENGKIDRAFGTDGVMRTDFDLRKDKLRDIAITASDAVVVAGSAASADEDEDDSVFALARYLP